MSAETAKIVLKTRTLRWSHPSEFDDTLDVAQACDEKMDSNKQKQIQDKVIDLAANPPPYLNENKVNETFKLLVGLIQSSPNKNLIIAEAKKEPVSDISNIIKEINKIWEKSIRNDFRILCLGIEKNNHRLWNDYAEDYKGAVIEFACRKESDSPWLVAKPVEYVREKELFLTAEDWAMVMVLETNAAAHYIIEKCSLRKANDNEHKWFEQNEWRIPSFRRSHETGKVSGYGVNPNDFSAVYFGHMMSIEFQNNIINLLDGNLGHVSAFLGKIDDSQNIVFEKVK